MANPTINCRASVFSTTAAASYATTGTYTPAAHSLLVAFVENSLSATPLDPTTFTGHGVTWTKLTLSTRILSTTHCASVWVADSGASPTSAAATAGFNSISQTGCSIIEFECSDDIELAGGPTNAVRLATVGTSASGTTGTVTYSAKTRADSAQISCFLHLANEVTNPRASWTESTSPAADGSFNTPATGFEAQYRNDGTFETTSTATWSTTINWLAIGLEILPAIRAGVGAIALAGQVALLVLGTVLGLGSVGVAGRAPTLSIANPAQTIAVPAGSVDISTPYIGVAFTGPEVGSIAVAGQAPTISISGSSGASIAVPAGSIGVTGDGPVLAFGDGIAAGSVSLAGNAPILASATSLPSGSVSLSGRAPTFASMLTLPSGAIGVVGQPTSLASAFAIPVGAVNLTGKIPALAGVTAVPASALTIAGQAPSAAFTLALPVGSISIIGLAPAVSIAGSTSTVIAIPAGLIGLSGQPASLAFGLAVGAGSVTTTGRAPILPLGIGLLQASVAVDGSAPRLATSSAIPSGSVSVAGAAPAAVIGLNATIPSGSVSVAGQVASLELGQSATPNIGAVNLSGRAPELGFTTSPAIGSISLVGLAPTVHVDHPIALPSGTLSVNGLTSTLAGSIGYASGQLACIGYPVTFSFGGVSVPAGSVDLTGHAPDVVRQLPIRIASVVSLSPIRSVDGTIDYRVTSLNPHRTVKGLA